jgi:hypothetical protein
MWFTIAAGQAPPPGSISADEIIRFVGTRVKGGSNLASGVAAAQ